MPDAVWLVLAVVGAGIAAGTAVPPVADRRLRRRAGKRSRRDRWVASLRQGSRVSRSWGPAATRRRRSERSRVIRAVAALASELEAGQPPSVALIRSGGEPSCWPAAAAAARHGGDVTDALKRDASHTPICGPLAACWQVGERSGAGLAAAVGRLAASARSAEEARSTLEGQLAVPRATARMLAGLPAVGIGFGLLLGADPVGWLTGTPAGRLCLAAGVAMVAVGLWWTARIAAAVERHL